MEQRRWDGDQVGHGTADARASAPAIDELVRLARRENWVTEDPARHLGDSIRLSLADTGVRWVGDAVSDGGAYEVTLSHEPGLNRRAVRRLAWAVLGTIAEVSTHVREAHDADSTAFHVVTGMPEGTSAPFSTHGHVLLVRFTPRG